MSQSARRVPAKMPESLVVISIEAGNGRDGEHEYPAWTNNPGTFTDGLLIVLNVLQHVRHDHKVDAGLGQMQVLHLAHHECRIFLPPANFDRQGRAINSYHAPVKAEGVT